MKINTRPSVIAVFAAVVIFNFSSCKYEDGPNISLRTKKARLTGECEAISIDGETLGKDFEVTIEFDKDGDFTGTSKFSYYGYSYSNSSKGEWEWIDGKAGIEVTVDGDKEEWEITCLTNKELQFKDQDNTEYELEKI